MIKQVSSESCNSQYDMIDLCSINQSVATFTKKFGVNFEVRLEDGLGECYFAFIEVKSNIYLLFGDCGGAVDEGVLVRMQGNNPSVENSVAEITKELDLKETDLTWVQDYFTEPKWALVRQGDDGNEVEISRFHREDIATHNMRLFEAKGHKQYYNVKEIQ